MSEASEAAEQVVRMMLSGGEIAVRLSGSALKNGAALLLALAKNHKNVFGKINLSKMLGMTPTSIFLTKSGSKRSNFATN